MPYDVPLFLQGKLVLPAGWRGTIATPLLVADIRGSGTVRIREENLPIGSAELIAVLDQDQRDVASIEVIESSDTVQIIMFMNAMRYEFASNNFVSLTGLDVWAIEPSVISLSESESVRGPGSAAFRKPVPSRAP